MFQNDVDQQESETLLTEVVRQKTRVHFMDDHYFSLHGVARLSRRHAAPLLSLASKDRCGRRAVQVSMQI